MTFLRKHNAWVARFLLLVFVGQMTLENVVTAGVTTPSGHSDFWGFNGSGSSSDLVGFSNGALNYSVPVASIPQYAMSIGYTSGNNLGKEAGMFGVGFNGFPGAINRSRMGLPDDLNNGQIRYKFSNQKNWNAGVGVTASAAFMKSFLDNIGLSGNATLSYKMGYNNYTGIFAALGIDLGIQKSGMLKTFKKNNIFREDGIMGSIGIGGGLNFDSRKDKATAHYNIGANLSVNKHFAKKRGEVSPSLGMGISGSSDGTVDFYTQGGVDVSYETGGKLKKNSEGGFSRSEIKEYQTSLPLLAVSKSILSPDKEDSRFFIPSTPMVSPSEIKVTSASISFPLFESPVRVALNADFSISNSGNETKKMAAYGYAFLKNASRDKQIDELTDFGIERENPYAEGKELNQVSHLQYDNFSVSAAGISGSFRYYQKEYGEVSRTTSRNQNRHFNLAIPPTMVTSRYEVYPYTKVVRSSIKKEIPILELLTKEQNEDDKDFDNFFFNNEEVKDLKDDAHSFGDVELRMQGDLAGSFSESMQTLNDPLKQEIKSVQGSYSSYNTFFLGAEQQAPSYYPDFSGEAKSRIQEVEEQLKDLGTMQSSNVKSYTVGELRTAYNEALKKAQQMQLEREFLKENFYSHYRLNSFDDQPVTISDNSNLNEYGFDAILENRTEDGPTTYFDNLTGGFEVENAEGKRFLFTLPVFDKKEKSISLQGKGTTPPLNGQDTYHSLSNARDRAKKEVLEDFYYPYAWLLTAIVGPTYVDVDEIPGPSDGDIGEWVKIKYVKTSDEYQWRTPYEGMSYAAGNLEESTDDNYSLSYGKKEIYYPFQIESSSHISQYNLFRRFDGAEAKGFVSGTAINDTKQVYNPDVNSLGDETLYGVASIDLFKKMDDEDFSKSRVDAGDLNTTYTKIRSTIFKYDYSTWAGPNDDVDKGLYNNLYRKNGSLEHDPSVLYNPNSCRKRGMLTLRSVQDIIYNESGEDFAFPSHVFHYNDMGLAYDPSMIDSWGNYKSEGKIISGKNLAYYSPYEEISYASATYNAKAYKLNRIITPSGGDIEVDYAPKSYASVSGKLPYVMRRVKNVQRLSDGVSCDIDVTDLVEANASLSDVFDDNFQYVLRDDDSTKVGSRTYAKDHVYGEIAFYMHDAGNVIRVQSEKDMSISGLNSTPVPDGDRYYQSVKLTIQDDDNPDAIPFLTSYEKYALAESPYGKAAKDAVLGLTTNPVAAVNSEINADTDNLLDAIKGVVSNLSGMFVRDKGYLVRQKYDNVFGPIGGLIEPALSYLRTPVYKGKHSGAVVKSVRKNDNFKFSTDGKQNSYQSNYYYDQDLDGTGIASAVCTTEPGIGEANVYDMSKYKGYGFQVAPQIIMSKVGVQDGVLSDYYKGADALNLPGVSRGKGMTVHEFYTSDMPGFDFKSNLKQKQYDGGPKKSVSRFFTAAFKSFIKISFKIFGKKISIKIPFILPLISLYKQERTVLARSIAYVDKSDIYGKPKSTSVIGEYGDLVSSTSYNYFEPDELVTIAKSGYDELAQIRPGVIEQFWGESFETKSSQNTFMLLFLKANSEFNHVRTVSKHVHVPAIVKSVKYEDRGRSRVVDNQVFHEYTGAPLQMQTTYSDNSVQTARNFPAYWRYPMMRPSRVVNEGTNQFNANYKSITYASKEPDPDSVLSASLSTYSDEWQIPKTYILPRKYESENSFVRNVEIINEKGSFKQNHYVPNNVDSKQSINREGRIVLRHSYFQSIEQYAPDFEINDEGIYENFDDVNANEDIGSEWIKVSSNNLFSAFNGEVLESQDVERKFVSKKQVAGLSTPVTLTGNAPYSYTMYSGAEYVGKGMNEELLLMDAIDMEMGSALKYEAEDCGDIEVLKDMILDSSAFSIPEGDDLLFNAIRIENLTSSSGELFAISAEINGVSRNITFNRADDGTIRGYTNYGEPYNGFFQKERGNGATYLYFKKSELTNIKVLSGQVVVDLDFKANWLDYSGCFLPKAYQIPLRVCFSDVHTGNYGFNLPPNSKGMAFKIPLENYSKAVHAGVFEMKVWVHQSTGNGLKLRAGIANTGDFSQVSLMSRTVEEVSLSEADIETPQWRLLKLRYVMDDLSPFYLRTGYYLWFYLDNQSATNALFDDYRVNPAGAGWQASLFDMKTGRVNYSFDDNHFATQTLYDDYGRPIVLKQEVENLGFVTIQKKKYGFQKR